jgi:hypothetical protein
VGESPDATTAKLKAALLTAWLHITTVLITALLLAGTVYTVDSVLAEGLSCPKILYVIVMYVPYIPASKNGLNISVVSTGGVVVAAMVCD